MAAYLTLEGMQCRTAFGGREANLIGTAWTPHVILMDISMPERNGFDAARVLRQELRTDSIAIVAHTALDEPEVRRQATADEFDG
ncbi:MULTISPECIES: response regulator [Caballeronia]|uniref:Response regulator n=1 Tax=Caballeronia jiangsuensis TaxID=1458357 RepID=A0ABW9CQW2_9BURK|nr:response regulator [Caballeronia sp. GaOx3]